MRILGARIFLSFLAGKLPRFKQLLLTELLSILAQVCDLPKKNLFSRVFITKTAEKVILSTTEVDENLT